MKFSKDSKNELNNCELEIESEDRLETRSEDREVLKSEASVIRLSLERRIL